VHVTAIIAAGGRGTRFGGAVPKQLVALGGQPILQRSVEAFVMHPRVTDIVVALPSALAAEVPAYLRGRGKSIEIVEEGSAARTRWRARSLAFRRVRTS